MAHEPCTSSTGRRKKALATEAAARFLAEYYAHVRGVSRGWYRCSRCDKWHVTSQTDRPDLPPLAGIAHAGRREKDRK